jgi:hypothetical protein
MTVQVFKPYLATTLNGVAIDTQLVRGARVEASFADPVSKGYIRCIGDPGGWSQGDPVTIAMGAGTNNTLRFVNGTILEGDWLNSGPSFELVCRGPLYAAQKFRNNRPKGRTLTDLTGGPATDEAIARAVLDIAGVSYSSGNIGGTGIVRGASAPDGYTWRQGESALEYLTRLSKASIGYKLVESVGGVPGQNVFRTQVLGTPDSSDFTLTEGTDLFEGAHVQKETFDTYSAWEVTGFDYGDGLHAVYNRSPDPIPDGVSPYAFSSEMIERGPDSDSRSGISAETVLNYLRSESSGAITKISGIVTPRDDLIGPGQVCFLNAPDTLGVSGNFWVLSVVVEVDDQWFTQTLELVG